jgi:serine/threonine-protein kinase
MALHGELQPGTIVGGTYEIVSLLGRGGMGAVWLARHLRLRDKHVAIKVLLGTATSGEAYLRFAREAEIAARIGHPNIVDALDFHKLETGEPYIVLEYLQGETLRDRMQRGPVPVADTFAIVRQIGSALHAAHAHDVVHRDLKPENVFLVPTDSGGTIRDHVKVLDFGISKLRGSQTVQTQEATVLGTPQYMAPEQAAGRNQDVDGRTDVFALGSITYEMLCGQPPFIADTPLGVMFKVVYEPTPPLGPLMPGLAQHAVLAIEKALAKDRDGRWPDVAAFVAALTGQPLQVLAPRARPTSGAMQVERDHGKDSWADTAAGGPMLVTEPRGMAGVSVDGETQAGTQPVSMRPAIALAPALATVPEPPSAALVAVAEVALPLPTMPIHAAADADRPPHRPKSRNGILRALLWATAGLVIASMAQHMARRNRDDDRFDREAAESARAAPALPAPVQPLAPPTVLAAPPAPVAPIPAPPPPVVPVAPPAPPAKAVNAASTSKEQPSSGSNPLAARAHTTPPTRASVAKAEATAAGDIPAEVLEELQRAEQAVDGNPSEALRLGRHVLLSYRASRVFGVLTRAHCRMSDLAAAQAMFRSVTGSERGRTAQMCRSAGVQLQVAPSR